MDQIKTTLGAKGLSVLFIVAVITMIITEVIKKTERIKNQWLPAVSVGVGLLIGILIGLVFFFLGSITPEQTVLISISGILSGAMASGLYDNLTTLLDKSKLF